MRHIVLGIALSIYPLHQWVAAATVAIDQVVPPYMGDGLEMAVTPWPREAQLADQMLVTSGLKVEATAGYGHPSTIEQAQEFSASLTPMDAPAGDCPLLLGVLGDGGAADKLLAALKLSPDATKKANMGTQGYVLFAGEAPGYPQGVVAIAGAGLEGSFFGLQSLRQLAVAKAGKVYIRTGSIVDWPAMDWRGSKRPELWCTAYKANYGSFNSPEDANYFRIYPAGAIDPQRGLKSWELQGGAKQTASRGLDASDAYINWLSAQWAEAYKNTGGTLFMLKGDDIELALDEKSGTKQRFGNDYGAAFVYLLTQLNARLKQLNPACTLYWMPNPYYTVNWDFELLSSQVRAAGGLPSEIGIWWTGHYVFSPMLTAADTRGYQQAFYGDNPIKVRGFIYDNHGRMRDYGGRTDDFFAMPQRDPNIAKTVRGLSNERGSPTNRITSYDFQWNPESYAAQRSLKLAVRELTARDPQYYQAVLKFIATYEGGRYPGGEVTTHAQAVTQQKAYLQELAAIGEVLQREGTRAMQERNVPENARGGDFRRNFLSQVLASISARQALHNSVDQMWRDANAPAYRISAGEVPKIDGKLDEACYQKAATIDQLMSSGRKMADPSNPQAAPLWEISAGVVPPEYSTQGWIMADEGTVYLGFRMHDKALPLPAGQAPPQPTQKEKVGNDWPYCWRQPCVDLNFDVRHDHTNTHHMIFDPLGQKYDEYLGWPGAEQTTGPPWSIGENYRVQREGDSWTVEAAIPLQQFGLTEIKAGDVWGFNVFRTGINVTTMHSMLIDSGPYGVRYPKIFGHLHWK